MVGGRLRRFSARLRNDAPSPPDPELLRTHVPCEFPQDETLLQCGSYAASYALKMWPVLHARDVNVEKVVDSCITAEGFHLADKREWEHQHAGQKLHARLKRTCAA